MSTRTPNINLEKPSSDENYSIAVFNGNSDTIDTEMALRVKTADIVNNLTTTVTNKPLSAAQGKALNDAKVNVSDIQNNLTSTATNKPLSAAQGKALSDTIANFRNASGGSPSAGSDANAVTTNGIYYRWYQSGSNFPNQYGGYLYVARHQSNTTYCSQLFIEDSTNCNVWVRINNGGTWTAWQKLVTANDIISETKSFTTSRDANPAVTVTVTKSGYTPIMASVEFTGNNHAFVYYCQIKNDTQVFLQFHGDESQVLEPLTGILRVVYKRN